MIGAGVFLATGFMAQSMGPGPIMLAWVVGAGLALCGATAYAAVARLVPRSGGEYRYLAELLHPALGYLAGWASLLLGFSAPIAVDALAAGAFAHRVWPALPPVPTAAALIVALTAAHAWGFRASTRTQNGIILVKALLLAAFVGVGLAGGAHAWPGWQPPAGGAGFPTGPFAANLFWIAFAYSGWNAAVYAAEEFRDPVRTVPRAMLLGTALVAVLYLTINWIFIANLTPADAAVVFRYESDQVTLGHVVMVRLLGARAGAAWSAVTVVVFLSAMSAMMFLGPRVYAAMARDGFLPRALAGTGDHPPPAAFVLQGALALVIVLTQGIRGALDQVGAVLVLFTALVAAALVVAAVRRRAPRPSPLALAAAVVYVGASGWMFWRGLGGRPRALLGLAVAVGVAFGAWALSRRRRRQPPG
jgi:APA family basic amino acid/polyamine antiporter